MRVLYEVLLFLYAIFYLPVFFAKRKWAKGVGQRFGIVPDAVREALKGREVVWVHAVSVGEVGVASRLISVLRQKAGRFKFVLTTTTVHGYDVASKIKAEEDQILFFPMDFGICVRRFVSGLSPKLVIILETEIWPNLIRELRRRRIPVFIMNGRISDNAMRRYSRLKFFFGPVLRDLSGIGVQDERMRSRFLKLGARPSGVFVTGNLKFDWHPLDGDSDIPSAALRAISAGGDPVFFCVAGSTHEGEEAIWFQVYRRMKAAHPRFRLLVAPRHINRIRSIEDLAAKMGVGVQKVSALGRNGSQKLPADPVLLLDQMGALAAFYKIADAVFVGGSLVPVGGHNPVEPAYFEKAVLFGPHMENFKEMAEEFTGKEAALQVRNAAELSAQLEGLMSDSLRRQALGRAARDLVVSHQGAIEKNLNQFLAPLGVI